MRWLIAGLAVLGLAVAGCSSDPSTSGEYQALVEQLANAEQALGEVTAERDALTAQINTPGSRYDKVVANQQAVAEIIANPTAYGDQEQVLDLLMGYAIPDAVMDDVALGSIGMREAWKETLYWTDSGIETFSTWVADDGSSGGSLWAWTGSAGNGEPFELIGVNIDSYDEEGMITYERVVWPYQDDYVENAIDNGN